MTPTTHSQTIPAAYVHLILRLCTERGIETQPLVEMLDETLLSDPGGRLPLQQVARLLLRVVEQAPDISFDIGLKAALSTHGFVGMGLMALPDVRAALEFGRRYVSLRTPFVAFDWQIDGPWAVIKVRSTMPTGPLHQFVFEHFLVGVWTIARGLAHTLNTELGDTEILFDFPRPDYFARYQDRLPLCRFDQALNALRFPSAVLDQALTTSDDTAAQLVLQHCERERAEIGDQDSTVVSRVRASLAQHDAPPSLDSMATRLHMSPRSLKRKLAQEASTYKGLVEEQRRQSACRWLRVNTLSIADIATRLGYTDPANFSRAFRKWTGISPTDFRLAATNLLPSGRMDKPPDVARHP